MTESLTEAERKYPANLIVLQPAGHSGVNRFASYTGYGWAFVELDDDQNPLEGSGEMIRNPDLISVLFQLAQARMAQQIDYMTGGG